MKHTPAPWFHIPRNRDGHVDIITDKQGNRDRGFVAVGCPVVERPILDYAHENTQTANARLIAAAPELLAALIGLADCAGITALPGFRADLDEAMTTARAVIDKATKPSRCTCGRESDGPVPNYCPEHDGEYSSFLAFNNCD